MNTAINMLVIIVILWFAYTRIRPVKGLRSLTEQEFRNELAASKNIILVDVREPSEYKSGFINGARNIPLPQLSRRLDEMPKDRDILLYCRSGMRSKNAARILHKHGYNRLTHLQGGINAWSDQLVR